MKKQLVILGAGESGVGTAILAHKLGLNVFVSDSGIIDPAQRNELDARQISYEQGQHTWEQLAKANEVVKSPGIPDDAPVVQRLRGLGVNIISEIEFAARYTQAKKICVTGSNGKTTTTLLTYHILKRSGLNVGLAGNVGNSLARQVAEHDYDYYVIELSSFQLDGMYEFKADVAVLLNITPDHLDRYQNNFQRYVDSKFRITQNLTPNDHLIYCSDDEVLMKEIGRRIIMAGMWPFSTKQKVESGGFLDHEVLRFRVGKEDFTMPVNELPLQGQHNVYNSLAAGISSKLMDIRNDEIRESMKSFRGAAHRLEVVNTVAGIVFINDSKATNINSAWYALDSMTRPTIWIVGGVDKGNDYQMIAALVAQKVKAIVCLGKDNQKLKNTFANVCPLYETQSMKQAVNQATELARDGDTVLLSPACASFDLFKNYEDRGNQFKEAVSNL